MTDGYTSLRGFSDLDSVIVSRAGWVVDLRLGAGQCIRSMSVAVTQVIIRPPTPRRISSHCYAALMNSLLCDVQRMHSDEDSMSDDAVLASLHFRFVNIRTSELSMRTASNAMSVRWMTTAHARYTNGIHFSLLMILSHFRYCY